MGELSANGIFDEYTGSISLDIDSGYILKGAFSTGVKITVTSLTELPVIELDPITTQLYMQSDLTGTASLGLLAATVSGDASLRGDLQLSYCSDCQGSFPLDGYEQAGDSSFYFSRDIGYNLDTAIGLSAGMPGVVVQAGAGIKIKDDDAFDDSPPMIQLPNVQALLDSIKFSPQAAVGESIYSLGLFHSY